MTFLRTLLLLATTAATFVSAAPVATMVGLDLSSISPLGCIGIPSTADDEHATACRAWFDQKKDECLSVDQAISTAKCVIGRLQGGSEAEHAGMCTCMAYYEALALSALATEVYGSDDEYNGYNGEADHDFDHADPCHTCHLGCPEGDQACHMICDDEHCALGSGFDDDFDFDFDFEQNEELLHQCHDSCDSFCEHFDFDNSGSGSGEAVAVDTNTYGTEDEPMRGRRFEEEHDLLADPCYSCHTGCIDEIFGSGFFGSGHQDDGEVMDEEDEQCHNDCEEDFPMTMEDWELDGQVMGESTPACHTCHEGCGAEDGECHLMCDETDCPYQPAPEATAIIAAPGSIKPRRSINDLRASAAKNVKGRSRRFSQNLQCHMQCDSGEHDNEGDDDECSKGHDSRVGDTSEVRCLALSECKYVAADDRCFNPAALAGLDILGDTAVQDALDAVNSALEASSSVTAAPSLIVVTIFAAAAAAFALV